MDYYSTAPHLILTDTNVELTNRIENANLLRLVVAYRTYGHKKAHLDPLGILEQEYVYLSIFVDYRISLMFHYQLNRNVVALDYKRYGFTDPNKVYNLNGNFSM